MTQKITAVAIGFLVAMAGNACGRPNQPDNGDDLVASYARDTGVDEAEATRRLQLEEEAGELDRRLSAEAPDWFAGLAIEHQPSFRIVVYSVVSEEQTRRQLAPSMTSMVPGPASLSGSLEVRQVAVTLAELQRTQDAAVQALRRLGLKVDALIDVRENRVELEVLDKDATEAALARAGVRLPPHVVIIEVDELTKPQAAIYGGASISTCTVGWSVEDASGTLGVATAAHCRNTQRHKRSSLPFQREAFGGFCDVQWHLDGKYTAEAKFIGRGPSNIRTVRATRPRASQAVGAYVCKYGKTSDYDCGTIESRHASPSYIPNATSTYIRVNRNGKTITAGGDSGGPWFHTNTAWGVHSGGKSTSSVYMAIDYVSSCLDVELRLAE